MRTMPEFVDSSNCLGDAMVAYSMQRFSKRGSDSELICLAVDDCVFIHTHVLVSTHAALINACLPVAKHTPITPRLHRNMLYVRSIASEVRGAFVTNGFQQVLNWRDLSGSCAPNVPRQNWRKTVCRRLCGSAPKYKQSGQVVRKTCWPQSHAFTLTPSI